MKITAPRLLTLSLRRSFLTAIVVLYVLTTVASVFVFVRTVRSVAREYVERFSVSQNLLERNRILAIIDRDATLSLKLADDPVVQAWMQNEQEASFREPALLQLESYRKLFRDRSYFVAIADGLSYYINTPETDGTELTVMDPDAPHDRWFFATLESEREFWINVDYNRYLNEIRVWINTLVRAEDGSLLGAAGTGLYLSEFLDALVEHEAPGVATIIVNADGQILAHRDRALIDHNARVTDDAERIDLDALLSSPEDVRLMRDARAALQTSSEAIETLAVELDGRSVTAAVGYIAELEWYNLVLVEEGQVIRLSDFYPLLQIVVISLIAVGAAMALMLNRLVLAPLGRLDRAAQRVAAGDYEVSLEGERANELGRVASSFGSMTEKVRDYTANLEQMVADRTRELRESQNRIVESIRYGKLIQSSIMPSETELRRHLSDSFVIHEPLDIVGGDFLYFRPLSDGFCIAVVDCTGHGVPGAFMTMLVSAALNRVMETVTNDTGTDEMLRQLHAFVQDSLRGAEDTEHLDNGFDIALCRYLDGTQDSTQELEFSGAGLPLLYSEGDKLQRIDGTRVRLGFRSTESSPAIARQRLSVKRDSVYYLLSDGVLDLPGGTNGFGLGNKGLERILSGLGTTPLAKQQELVQRELHRYQGEWELRDDVILLGFSPLLQEVKT